MPENHHDLELFLAKIPLFSSIPLVQIQEMARQFSCTSYEKGAVICREGEFGDTLFIIRSGVVAISVKAEDNEIFLSELRRGDFFGEMALLSETPRNATARVSLDAMIYSLGRAAFEMLLMTHKSLGLYLSRYYARRMAHESSRVDLACRGGGTPPKPVFYAVSATDSGLGLYHFLYSVAFHIATESPRKVLIVEPQLELRGKMHSLGLHDVLCPDTSLFDLLPTGLYKARDFQWFQHPSGFMVLQVNQGFSEHLSTTLPHLMESFRDRFDLTFFALSHQFNALERLLVRLCDKSLVLITNTEKALPQVRRRLDEIESMTGTGLDRVRVGVSHLLGARGVARQDLQKRLNLSEVPQIWVDRSDSACQDRIDTEKRFPIKGVRAVAREIAGVRVGLALGAGAARGWAHIGVLKVLEDEKIPIDMISGSSMGALVGGIYGACASVDHLKRYTIDLFPTKKIARRGIFDYTLPVNGVLKGKKAMDLVARAVNGADFLDLQIPSCFIGVDILKGEEVLMEKGSVAEAVRASISIPGIFEPYPYDGRWMVDGGLLNPVPVDRLIQKGADRVIAVCVEKQSQAGEASEKPPGIMSVISNTMGIVHSRAVGNYAEAADIVIYPDVGGFAWDDFHQGQVLMKRGMIAAQERLDEIRKACSWQR